MLSSAGDGSTVPPEQVRLEVGPVAHGGHCVARYEGRVVFVRHALPGEVVLARLDPHTGGERYWRADAVEVISASPDRVPPPCPLSGPGGCGGCDWQHASPAAQRAGKAAVVAEQLLRLARIEWPQLSVEAVPGDRDGLAWRTRMHFGVDRAGRPGLRRHRSHDLVPVPACPIAHPEVEALAVGRRRWPRSAALDVVAGGAGVGADGGQGARLVVVQPRDPGGRADVPPLPDGAGVAVATAQGLVRVRGRTWVEEQVRVDGQVRRFRVTGAGFWQVHPGAAQTLLDAVLETTAPAPGERALDLYCGVGLFSAGLAARVTTSGSVLGVEGDDRAVADGRRSLHDLPQVRLEAGRVDRVLSGMPAGERADVVVLDPPRTGAGRVVIGSILRLAPRVVAYVACDPASLARDVATAGELGYRLSALRAFDCFPMTAHVECVATLTPA